MDSLKKIDILTEILVDISVNEDKPCLSSSLSVEDLLITDIISKNKLSIDIFCIDTGRLHQETYNLMQEVKKHYNKAFTIYSPESSDLETYINNNGPNAFYESIDYRKLCCNIRKVLPLQRALKNKTLWITGLRKQQSSTRDELALFEWEENFKIHKCNPLRDWSTDDVWDYIYGNSVPYNKLHDKGYPSIGCEPCTRAIKNGEDIRAGRWWWEAKDGKECGLHGSAIANNKVLS